MQTRYRWIAVLLFLLSFSALMPAPAAQAQGPDLTIAKIERNAVGIRVNVRNEGVVQAGASVLQVFVWQNNAWVPVAQANVKIVPAGGNKWVDVKLPPGAKGKPLKVVVDATGVVPETNEANNTAYAR